MKMKTMINMAADRAAFIDQSQSFNIFVGSPNFAKLTAIHFYGWKKVRLTLSNIFTIMVLQDLLRILKSELITIILIYLSLKNG